MGGNYLAAKVKAADMLLIKEGLRNF